MTFCLRPWTRNPYKRGLLLKERICFYRSKFSRVDPHGKGDKTGNDRLLVTWLESVSVYMGGRVGRWCVCVFVCVSPFSLSLLFGFESGK